jgi:hypothetical protein
MHQDGTPSSKRAKNRCQGYGLRVERRYEPDFARQAQALLRLLARRSRESTPRQRNEDTEQLDQALPTCEGTEND